MTAADDAQAPDRIDLPGGWRFEPKLHPHTGTPTGYGWLFKPNRMPGVWFEWDVAVAFAAAMSTPAPRLPSREEVQAIVFAALLEAPARELPFSKRVAVRDEVSALATDAVLALLSAPAQAARGTVIDGLRAAEAALADIGEGEREPGDDLAWCEKRAKQALPVVRAALQAASLPSRSEPAAPVEEHHP